MSITDELRKWIDGLYTPNSGELKLQAECIADRIDAEHEAACAEAYGNGVQSVPIALDESQWVKLPVDADGVPIHVGDVMDRATVSCIRDAGRGWEIVLDNWCTYQPTDLHHHHEPTVEDVLREFADEVKRCCDDESTIAEYAAKLRLAGEDE